MCNAVELIDYNTEMGEKVLQESLDRPLSSHNNFEHFSALLLLLVLEFQCRKEMLSDWKGGKYITAEHGGKLTRIRNVSSRLP